MLAPLNYEEQGVVTGYSTELLQAVLQTAGLSAPISMMPWARAYQTAQTQPNTIIYSIVRTAERESLFDWIGPISKRQIFLFKLRARKDVEVNTLADARNYRIGAVREMAATQQLIKQGFKPDENLDLAPTDESNVKKLFLNRVDLIAALDWSAYFLAKQNGHSATELEPVMLLDNSHAYYFALNKQSDATLTDKLNQAFEKVRASGQMDKLRSKYVRD
jgi:polar amino acid transport system substrate-binding protein